MTRDEEPLDLLRLAHAAGCVVLADAEGRVEIVPDPREPETAAEEAQGAAGGAS